MGGSIGDMGAAGTIGKDLLSLLGKKTAQIESGYLRQDLGPVMRDLMSRAVKTGAALPSELGDWARQVRMGIFSPDYMKQLIEQRLGIRQFKVAQAIQKGYKAGLPRDVLANMSYEARWHRFGNPEELNQEIDKMIARKTPGGIEMAPEEVAKAANRFHGSRTPIKELLDYTYSPQNIYGQGFYTTDNVDVARGYAGKDPGRGVYPIIEKGAQKLVDLDKPPPKEALDYIENAKYGPESELTEYFKENPKATLRQWYDEMRNLADDAGYSGHDIQEAFDGLAQHLESKGYTGLTHEGGWNTGGAKHQVNIYFNPKKSIQLGKAFLGLGGAVGLFGLGTFGKPSQAEAAEDPSGAVRPVMADSNSTLEISQNPNAEKLRLFLASPNYKRALAQDPVRAQQYAQAIANGQPLPALPPAQKSTATPGAARKPLGAAEQKQLAQLQAAYNQLSSLRDQFKQIDPQTWDRSGGQSRPFMGVETAGMPTRMVQKYLRGHGASLVGAQTDPKIKQLNDLIGATITQHGQATAALMQSSGTRNYKFAEDAAGHLPMAEGDYATNMGNLNYLLSDKGPYKNMMREIQNGTGNLPYTPDSASPMATPAPMGMATPMATPSADPVAAALAKHGVTP